MLININNPNVFRYIRNGFGPVNLHDIPPQNRHYRIFENIRRHTLYEHIVVQSFSGRHAKLIFKKILNGVSAIHNLNICYRDIRPENIYLDENFNPKISSFNMSCINVNNLDEFNGALSYMAPEILPGKQVNHIME